MLECDVRVNIDKLKKRCSKILASRRKFTGEIGSFVDNILLKYGQKYDDVDDKQEC